jgi:uncharacterized ParB-like nuclease family protein
MPVIEIPIVDLIQESIRENRAHLHSDRVTYYLAHLDLAPPVTVFDLDGHLLLADGHHRVEAAQRLGRDTIKADVRQGSRGDALRFAVDFACQQRPMSEKEALAAIERRGHSGRDLG